MNMGRFNERQKKLPGSGRKNQLQTKSLDLTISPDMTERLVAQRDRIKSGLKSLRFKESKGNKIIGFDDKKLDLIKELENLYLSRCETFASGSPEFQAFIIKCLKGLTNDPVSTINAGVAFLYGLGPRDEIETMLITQMFTSNLLAMEFSARAFKGDDPDLVDRNVARFSKLIARYAEQLEALNKHRGKGQQKVTVEYVNVHSGGQAIVAPIMESKPTGNGGGVNGKNE